MYWMRNYKALLFCVLLFAISNCIEPYAVRELTTDYNYLVVQGVLINGSAPSSIQLSRTTTLKNTEQKEVIEANASVQLEEENGSTHPFTGNGMGLYTLPPINLNHSKKYRLHIQTSNKKEYTSDFVEFRESPEIDQLKWIEQPDGIQVFISTSDQSNKTKYYLWTFEETWKYTAKYYSNYVFDNGVVTPRQFSDELYYCYKSIRSPNLYVYSTQALSEDVVNNYPLFFIPKKSQKLVYAYSLEVSQIAITKKAYEYWSTLLKNNEHVGSLFDALPAQDIGNLHCVDNPGEPVLGYFSISSITHKRIFIDRQEITGPNSLYDSSGYETCTKEYIPLNQLSSKMQGKLIVENKFGDVSQQLEGYIVSTQDCIDCRLHGGTLSQPDFWK
ncbi:MAG: hypothetical protein DI538_17395 [Azospira oryzae]|jgi:hypothetical protein|nr:MAG: hypothetical protein DI538_17395 [Azospira oryzae]